MTIIRTKTLTTSQKHQIDQMWDSHYPTELKGRFKKLLDGVENFTHYLLENSSDVVAWAVTFFKDNETRFSVIVHENYKGHGLGAAMMACLKEDLDEFYGWVIDHNDAFRTDGENYLSPLGFYERLGFEVLHNERIDTEMIKAVKIKYLKS